MMAVDFAAAEQQAPEADGADLQEAQETVAEARNGGTSGS